MNTSTFNKNTRDRGRYIQSDLSYGVKQKPRPEGWEDGLTSEEFLEGALKILRKKFNAKDARNKVS